MNHSTNQEQGQQEPLVIEGHQLGTIMLVRSKISCVPKEVLGRTQKRMGGYLTRAANLMSNRIDRDIHIQLVGDKNVVLDTTNLVELWSLLDRHTERHLERARNLLKRELDKDKDYARGILDTEKSRNFKLHILTKSKHQWNLMSHLVEKCKCIKEDLQDYLCASESND